MQFVRALVLPLLVIYASCFLDATASELSELVAEVEKNYPSRSAQELGDYTQALEGAFISSRDIGEKVKALQLISDIEATRGRKGRAISSLSEAVELSGTASNSLQHARTLSVISSQYQALGADAKARNVLENAIEILEKNTRQAPELMAWYRILGYLEGELGNPKSAEINFRKRLLLPDCLDKLDRSRTLLNIIKAMLRQENSTVRLQQTILEFNELFQALPDGRGKSILAVDLGSSIARLLSPDDLLYQSATAYLQYGLLTANERGDTRYQSYALGYLGKIALESGDYKKALDLTRKAMTRTHQGTHHQIEYLWQWQIAKIKWAQNDTGSALDNYRSAISSIENMRAELLAGSRVDFRELVLPVYREMTDLLLSQASLSSLDENRQALLFEAREVMEMFNTSEILDYYHGDCVLPSNQLALESLGKDNVIIYPLALDDRLSVIIKLPDGIYQYVTQVDKQVFHKVVDDFRDLLELGDDDFLIEAATLYSWLIKPFELELKKSGIKNIVFVPTGQLRTVPLSALFDGEHYLIESYAVTTSLGLQLTDPKPLKDSGYKVLLGGLSEAVEDFEELPGVTDEINQINAMFGGDILINDGFTIDTLSRHLGVGDYSVVHLATHGYFDQEPSLSFLLTYDGKFSLEQLQDTVGLRRFVDEPLELLVLSACETARGNERAALGLAGVSLKSGARSTLASLWKISDEATSKIMISFYKHLKKGFSKAESLQLAQLELIRNPEYSHPRLWSPYLLIGNWL